MTKHFIFLTFTILFNISFINAQILNPVTWDFDKNEIGENTYELIFKANIEDAWHLYAMDLPKGGPIPTSIHFEESENYKLIDKTIEKVKPEVKFDQTFGMEMKLFSNKAIFIQKVKIINTTDTKISGYVEFMSCDDSRCLPPKEVEFEFLFGKEQPLAQTKKQVSEQTNEQKPEIETSLVNLGQENNIEVEVIDNKVKADTMNKSMLLFFLLSFVIGLAGILTPCVFPMIPMTISFFSRNTENKAKSILAAAIFGLSIVIIYTLFGVLFSAGILGKETTTILSTHWIPNLIFFLIFITFAISFFGVFEIVLPGSLINKVDAQADKGGLLGSFFIALTTVIVSFSCTGPFVATIIIEAIQGAVIKPVIGMFGFGLGFGLPFTIFAIIPSALKKLPKSGGWMNSVKVVFAFILLAFGMKFLSNIDQSYHIGILPRQVFLAIWIVLNIMLGLYFLGRIKFAHDTEVKNINLLRFILAISVFSFALYLFPGLFGAPLHGVSALIPPKNNNSFDLAQMIRLNQGGAVSQHSESELCGTPKYADIFYLPHGLKGYFDYEEGMKCAKEKNKPVLLDFKGHSCANCKLMENKVWSNPDVLKHLKQDYIIIALYVDDKTKLPKNEWITSSYDGKVKKTIGKKNLDFQISNYNINSQPYYVLLDNNGKNLTSPIGMELNTERFIEFLDEGVKNFKK